MAWSTPLTAVANATLTASQWNASVRDNLLTTAPALATTSGSHFVATGSNAIAQRRCQTATVATSQTTTATGSYHNLTTVGPSITATTGTLGITWATCQMTNDTTDATTYHSVDISGATTDAAADARAAIWEDTANRDFRFTATTLHTLTAGSNVFKIMYKVQSNNGTFSKRDLVVMPL